MRRRAANMMPMFLSVFLSGDQQNFTEVPVTPQTLCRDVLEVCKEPGGGDCYLAETWRGSERVVGEEEHMMQVLLQWGQQMGEVRYLLHHQRAPGGESGCRDDQLTRRNRLDNELSLNELQDLATRQQRQINVQQQLLASKEQRLRKLKLQDHQEASEQERLQKLRENAHNQEAKLRRVRALRGQLEHKRLGNSKLVEEMEQMTALFLQKQQELLEAVARVEELNHQLEALRSNRTQPTPPHHHTSSCSSSAQLERLWKELQLRNGQNQEQNLRLQQQKDSLTQKNQEVAAMEQRLSELRQRLWKKKDALQSKENLTVIPDGSAPRQGMGSRVAAVGPYIQSSQGPVKPTSYPDATATLPMTDPPLKPPPRPAKPTSGFFSSLPDSSGTFSSVYSTLPRNSTLSRRNSESEAPPPVPARTNHCTEKLLRDNQASGKGLSWITVPPPVPAKPKPITWSGSPSSKPAYSTGTFPGKARAVGASLRTAGVSTLPLPHRQEGPPAATVRPYAPDLCDGTAVLQKPQTVATSSIYSIYTRQTGSGQGTLPRTQSKVYGKPVLAASGGQQAFRSDADSTSETVGGNTAEHAPPRPLSPTKLLPFLSGLQSRRPSDADLDALRRRLHHAPRPLKKRSSITEPEGPSGPNIQKLLYQKTTLAAMETLSPEGVWLLHDKTGCEDPTSKMDDSDTILNHRLSSENPEDLLTPPPLPPRSPIPDNASSRSLGVLAEQGVCPTLVNSDFLDEFPPYPPPPYHNCEEAEPGDHSLNFQPPEVTGQVTVPSCKRSILRKMDSDRLNHGLRVKFNPLSLLLDSALEGEYDLVQRVVYDVDDPSSANDEGITALHNAVCAGHTEIVKFLVQFGVNVNAADSDGWTPLHCAASCNNVQVCKFLVESGAAVFATTYSDMQTAPDKCEEMEEGYAQCSEFLYGVQERMGVMNRGVVYALWDYEPQGGDELKFSEGDCMTVLRREDKAETEWWWARCGDHEGYIPRNLLGLYLRIKPRQRSLA